MITTIWVQDESQLVALAKLAKDLGILVKGGPGTGKNGSVSGLMQAIAEGGVTVELKPNLKDSKIGGK